MSSRIAAVEQEQNTNGLHNNNNYDRNNDDDMDDDDDSDNTNHRYDQYYEGRQPPNGIITTSSSSTLLLPTNITNYCYTSIASSSTSTTSTTCNNNSNNNNNNNLNDESLAGMNFIVDYSSDEEDVEEDTGVVVNDTCNDRRINNGTNNKSNETSIRYNMYEKNTPYIGGTGSTLVTDCTNHSSTSFSSSTLDDIYPIQDVSATNTSIAAPPTATTAPAPSIMETPSKAFPSTTSTTLPVIITPPSITNTTVTNTSSSSSAAVSSKALYRMEQEIIAKQQGRHPSRTTKMITKKREPIKTVGSNCNNRSKDEENVHDVSNSSKKKLASVSANGTASGKSSRRLVDYKSISMNSIMSGTASVRPSYNKSLTTNNLSCNSPNRSSDSTNQNSVDVGLLKVPSQKRQKLQPMSREDAILQLDERIATRNSKVRLSSTSKRNVMLQSSIVTPSPSSNHPSATVATASVTNTGGFDEEDLNEDSIRTPSMGRNRNENMNICDDDDNVAVDGTIPKVDKSGAVAVIGPKFDTIGPHSALYSADGFDDDVSLISGLLPVPNNNCSNENDLEYGIFHTTTNNNVDKELAVAFAVNEDYNDYLLQNCDTYIPSAVEYDPDAKQSTIPFYYKNRRFRLYTCLAIIVVIVGTITASVGVTLTQSDALLLSPTSSSSNNNNDNNVVDTDIPYRQTLGIRTAIEQVVGIEKLNDMNSPYRKALDWIQDIDPLALIPSNPNFLQRYFVVYFYYATSIRHPWSSGCNPPNILFNETDLCSYKKITTLDPLTYTEIPWQRWLTKEFECSWAGIYCDDAGFIRSLDFSGSNLTGTFPEGIIGFPFLQSFSFAFSQLEGPLPDVLVEMKHLVNIEVQGNLFTGTIPSAWYKSKSIQRINLSINQISGPISPDMAEVKDMKGIFIYENLISGSLPTEVGLMRSLSFFRINRNYLHGTIPSTIGNLQLLYDVWIQRNMFSGPIPSEFGLLDDLTDFRAQVNLLSGSIPNEFYNLPSIRRVDIFENRLNGTISPNISKLSLLDQFRINDNQFSGTIPTEMGLMTNLAAFVASGNNLVGTVPDALCNLRERDFGMYFVELQTDCIPPRDGSPQIVCPNQCCTTCCDAKNGTICIPTG